MRFDVTNGIDRICLGIKGENDATTIRFVDFANQALIRNEIFTVGSVVLRFEKPVSGNVVEKVLELSDSGIPLWKVTREDLNEVGHGRCELTFTKGLYIRKSKTYTVIIYPSIIR